MKNNIHSNEEWGSSEHIKSAAIITSNQNALNSKQWLFFWLLHIPLAFGGMQYSIISTIHALLTLVVGIMWASSKKYNNKVFYVGGYIVGAEVFWRMTDASIFHEFGKYALILILIIALFRQDSKGPNSLSALPIFYFIFLLPSIVLVIDPANLYEAREQISFNLSGPLALMISVYYFSRTSFALKQVKMMMLAMLAPILGIASVNIVNASSLSIEYFMSHQGSSLSGLSGGFAPNQVSSILGLGALVAFLFIIVQNLESVYLRMVVGISGILFAMVSVLTFSRGGIYMAGIGAIIAILHNFQTTQARLKSIIIVIFIGLITIFILGPVLVNVTGGAVLHRFTDSDMTGRDQFLLIDLETWQQNFLIGVGPGGSAIYRGGFVRAVAAHTEFTRILAEHGLFGFSSLVVFLIITIKIYNSARITADRTITAALLIWVFSYLFIDAMRLAASGFIFGIAAAKVINNEEG